MSVQEDEHVEFATAESMLLVRQFWFDSLASYAACSYRSSTNAKPVSRLWLHVADDSLEFYVMITEGRRLGRSEDISMLEGYLDSVNANKWYHGTCRLAWVMS